MESPFELTPSGCACSERKGHHLAWECEAGRNHAEMEQRGWRAVEWRATLVQALERSDIPHRTCAGHLKRAYGDAPYMPIARVIYLPAWVDWALTAEQNAQNHLAPWERQTVCPLLHTLGEKHQQFFADTCEALGLEAGLKVVAAWMPRGVR